MAPQSLRQKSNLPKHFNLILPVQSWLEKFFILPVGQIIFTSPRVSRPQGAFRDRHERWVRDAVDALAWKTNAQEADGEATWF